MPLYEYKCDKCGDIFELIEKFVDTPLTTHEKCGGPVHRLISAPALQFKGSGWYVNDYAKGGSSSAPSAAKKEDSAAKPSSSESSSSAATPAKSDTKPSP